jgi:predicted DNA-binding transcriptional regulator AlpA
METDRFIRITKADKRELHFSRSTLYKWHSMGKFPSLFRLVEGTLFIDLKELNRIIEER